MPRATKGLLLVLGGAPNTPHTLEGLPGYYSPTSPHLAGDGYDISLETAEQAAEDRPDILELVSVSPANVADALEAHEAFLEAGRNELLEARRDGRAEDDSSRTEDEREALAAAAENTPDQPAEEPDDEVTPEQSEDTDDAHKEA